MAHAFASEQSAPRLQRVAPELPVGDMAAAFRWYEERLRFRTASVMPHGDYAIVERGGVALHLFRGKAAGPVALHVFVEGIEAFAEELASRGADVAEPLTRRPWGARDLRLFDPWGNELKFTELR